MRLGKPKILVVSCHTDDAEIGCGAFLHQLVKKQYEVNSAVYVINYSGFSKEELLLEWHQSMSILNIPNQNQFVFDYPARKLSQYRQEILEDLIELRKKLNPDYILTPTIENIHQDHHTIGLEALRAFRDKTLWNYELPWSELAFKPQVYVPISDEDLQVKINAIKKYKSQSGKSYLSGEFITGLALMRGVESGLKLAEAFVVQRMIRVF